MLLFTDGLTDNLHWHEVLRKVDEVVEEHAAGRRRLWKGLICRKTRMKRGCRPRNGARRLGAA